MVATNTMTVTKTIRTLPQPKQWLIVGMTVWHNMALIISQSPV